MDTDAIIARHKAFHDGWCSVGQFCETYRLAEALGDSRERQEEVRVLWDQIPPDSRSHIPSRLLDALDNLLPPVPL